MTLQPLPGRYAWRQAKVGDWPALIRFLARNEPAWLSLIDRLERAAPYWTYGVQVLAASALDPIAGVFMLNASGLALLALADEPGPREWQLAALVRSQRRQLGQLYCLIGLPPQLDAMLIALDREALARNAYELLARPPAQVRTPGERPLVLPAEWPGRDSPGFVWRGLEIRRCYSQDLERLIELQCAYELEEVIIPGHQLNRNASRRGLETSLREQCIFAAEAPGLVVAKAGTNGCSWNYAQIGGVFTAPGWRRHGIGECLMEALLAQIFHEGLGASLFVKRQNLPAQQLYRKLGFEPAGELSIIYF